MAYRNRAIIACAGSGKTTRLVLDAIENRDRRIAFITYTIQNTRTIVRRFGERYGGVPKHVNVMTWFAFLLRECARPYQHAVYSKSRIESICYVTGQSTQRIPEARTGPYFFAGDDLIYSDKVSQFAIRCEQASGQLVTRRLQKVYTDIFIDECQDLAGWDWEWVESLLKSGIRVTLVGDPRQGILNTNMAAKNKQLRRSGVTSLLEGWEKSSLCQVEQWSVTRRCNSAICRFVNLLWPDMEEMTPLADSVTGHDGVFLVGAKDVEQYIGKYRPQVLRRQRPRRPTGYEDNGLNFGVAKGLEWDRVLIVPSGPIKKYLETGDLTHLKEKERLHVAVTRAFHSVAFVFDGVSPIVPNRWCAS